jgi:hypothetical protein
MLRPPATPRPRRRCRHQTICWVSEQNCVGRHTDAAHCWCATPRQLALQICKRFEANRFCAHAPQLQPCYKGLMQCRQTGSVRDQPSDAHLEASLSAATARASSSSSRAIRSGGAAGAGTCKRVQAAGERDVCVKTKQWSSGHLPRHQSIGRHLGTCNKMQMVEPDRSHTFGALSSRAAFAGRAGEPASGAGEDAASAAWATPPTSASPPPDMALPPKDGTPLTSDA